MSIENVIYGSGADAKLKALASKHNKAITHIKAIGLPAEQEKPIIDSVKNAYVAEHDEILANGLDMDADVTFAPKTRQKKVKTDATPPAAAPEVKPDMKPLTPAEKAKQTKAANAAKGKGNTVDDDPSA